MWICVGQVSVVAVAAVGFWAAAVVARRLWNRSYKDGAIAKCWPLVLKAHRTGCESCRAGGWAGRLRRRWFAASYVRMAGRERFWVGFWFGVSAGRLRWWTCWCGKCCSGVRCERDSNERVASKREVIIKTNELWGYVVVGYFSAIWSLLPIRHFVFQYSFIYLNPKCSIFLAIFNGNISFFTLFSLKEYYKKCNLNFCMDGYGINFRQEKKEIKLVANFCYFSVQIFSQLCVEILFVIVIVLRWRFGPNRAQQASLDLQIYIARS